MPSNGRDILGLRYKENAGSMTDRTEVIPQIILFDQRPDVVRAWRRAFSSAPDVRYLFGIR